MGTRSMKRVNKNEFKVMLKKTKYDKRKSLVGIVELGRNVNNIKTLSFHNTNVEYMEDSWVMREWHYKNTIKL